MRQTTDQDETMSTNPDESYNLGWLSTTQTIVHGGILCKTSDERFDFVWLSTKQTSDHNWCLSITQKIRYDYG